MPWFWLDIRVHKGEGSRRHEIKKNYSCLRFLISLLFSFPHVLRFFVSSDLVVSSFPSFLRFLVSSFLHFLVSSFLRFFVSSFFRFLVSSFLCFFVLRFLIASFLRCLVSSNFFWFLCFFLSSFLSFFVSLVGGAVFLRFCMVLEYFLWSYFFFWSWYFFYWEECAINIFMEDAIQMFRVVFSFDEGGVSKMSKIIQGFWVPNYQCFYPGGSKEINLPHRIPMT